ncbi:hypothetical protein DPEC_G00346350 [Dallia pectoralis]|uniref:Uncharacterized protein n=1 Tax=Dallia pectoralis TaxID=75939 RepID=A0ACC2F3T0_DALPE|nr:hypothetical protein DPEC_G00346350 [Dallia pectoralis]
MSSESAPSKMNYPLIKGFAQAIAPDTACQSGFDDPRSHRHTLSNHLLPLSKNTRALMGFSRGGIRQEPGEVWPGRGQNSLKQQQQRENNPWLDDTEHSKLKTPQRPWRNKTGEVEGRRRRRRRMVAGERRRKRWGGRRGRKGREGGGRREKEEREEREGSARTGERERRTEAQRHRGRKGLRPKEDHGGDGSNGTDTEEVGERETYYDAR